MAVVTGAQWKSFIAKNDLKGVKPAVGKFLDAYHNSKGVKAKMKTLEAARGAMNEFRVTKEVIAKDKASPGIDDELERMIKDADLRMKVLVKREQTLDDVRSLSLKDVMKNSKIYKEFVKFCKKEHNEENLNFLKDCYGKSPQVVYNTYIKEGSSEQVNIPDTARKKLDELAEQEAWGDMDFSAAHKIIFALVSTDTLHRFLAAEVKEIQEIVDSED